MEELKGLGGGILNVVSKFTNGAGFFFAKDLVDKVGSFIEYTKVKPSIGKAIASIPEEIRTPTRHLETELVPPGTCLHLC